MTFALLFLRAAGPDDTSSGRVGGAGGMHGTAPIMLSAADRAVVDAVRVGNEDAFRKVFETYYPALARFARHAGALAADVDEIIADVFLGVWNRRTEWNPAGGVAAYLFRAVRNRARNTVRDARTARLYLDQAARESAPGMGEIGVAAEQEVEIADRESRLWSAIGILAERPRTLLELRWRAGLSPAEIAATLGMSVTAVNTGLSRAVRALRDVLPDDFR